MILRILAQEHGDEELTFSSNNRLLDFFIDYELAHDHIMPIIHATFPQGVQTIVKRRGRLR